MRDFFHCLGLGLAFIGALLFLFTDVGVFADALTAGGLAIALVFHDPATHGLGDGRR